MKSLPPPARCRRVLLGLHNDPAYGVPEGNVRPTATHAKDTSLPESPFLHSSLLYYHTHSPSIRLHWRVNFPSDKATHSILLQYIPHIVIIVQVFTFPTSI